jgi:F-type H+-transporting ATPase subunit delta
MTEHTTIARPYAKAAFELAQRDEGLAAWSRTLDSLATVVSEPAVSTLIGNPRVDREQLVDLLLSCGGEPLQEEARSLVRVMAEAGRLPLLPAVAALFEVMRADAEGRMEAQVVSARPLSPAQKRKISDALKERFHREVKLRCKTDRSLIGGAVIHAGDLVIDGSVQGQLARLATALTH